MTTKDQYDELLEEEKDIGTGETWSYYKSNY